MSQLSPDGRYVLTMLRDQKAKLANSYFVVNFTDYRFLQVFYPTPVSRWYDRATARSSPCREPTIRAMCIPTRFGVPTENM